MEDNNNLPSIPCNYVTLAQLQERWLKQKEKEKQLHEKQQEEQQQKQQQQIPKLPQHNPPEYHRGRRPETLQLAWRAIPACPTGSRHAAVECPPAESGPKNPISPGSNRVAVEVSRETNESVEAKADIGDGNNGKDGKKKQSKKKVKSGKGKPRAGEEKKIMAEDAMASTMMGKKEAANSCVQRVDDKRETKIELNGSKSNDLGIEVEQKLGTIPMNFESEKQNSRVNTCARSRGSQRDNGGRNYRIGPYGWAYKEKKKMAEDATQSTMVWNKEAANSGVQRIDGKKEAKVELNDSKSNDLMMEVEQKMGTVSMNSENEKQNSRLKTYDSSRGSQRNNEGRNNRIGTYSRAAKEKKKLAEDAMQSTMEGNKEVANSDVQRVDDKRETKIELHGSKSNDLGIEVEQKLGTISMNSENEKQTSRVKTQDSSRSSQRNDGGRNYRIGPYGDRYSNFGPYGDRYSNFGPYGGRIRAQKNWVRKSEDSNGNVNYNEISSK